MPRPLRIILLSAAALIAVAAGLATGHWINNRPPDMSGLQATLLKEPRQLPDFRLVDDNGAAFGPAELGGEWSVLFFGFSHCPDVCPSTLQTLASARARLADLPPWLQPRIVFVSVDPQRDTPEQLHEYLGWYKTPMTGLTGDEEELDRLAGSVGVAYRTEPVAGSNYAVDHSAALFLINPQRQLAAVLTPPHDAASIAADLRLIMKLHGSES